MCESHEKIQITIIVSMVLINDERYTFCVLNFSLMILPNLRLKSLQGEPTLCTRSDLSQYSSVCHEFEFSYYSPTLSSE